MKIYYADLHRKTGKYLNEKKTKKTWEKVEGEGHLEKQNGIN